MRSRRGPHTHAHGVSGSIGDDIPPCRYGTVTLFCDKLPSSPPMCHFLQSSQQPWMDIWLPSFSYEETKMWKEPCPQSQCYRSQSRALFPDPFDFKASVFCLKTSGRLFSHSNSTVVSVGFKRQPRNDRERWRSWESRKSYPVKFPIWNLGLTIVHHGCGLVFRCFFTIGKWNSAILSGPACSSGVSESPA